MPTQKWSPFNKNMIFLSDSSIDVLVIDTVMPFPIFDQSHVFLFRRFGQILFDSWIFENTPGQIAVIFTNKIFNTLKVSKNDLVLWFIKYSRISY